MPAARHLVFFGFSGTPDPTGTADLDNSFFLTAHTLKLHLEKRFPGDTVEVVCAWHKDTFINTLRAPGPPIRQIHYVGHEAGGGLFFGYHNAVAVAERQKIADVVLARPLAVWLGRPDVQRRIAQLWDSGLMSGLLSEALEPATLAQIRAQLLPDALMHIWGCFAGAPVHTFDRTDPYWNLFNAGGASVDGVARHIAKTLRIEATACWDPDRVHGMDFCFRTSKGALNCSNKRPGRLPHWLWPESGKVRWITYDPKGTGDETMINFLGTRIPAKDIPPGHPPEWLRDAGPGPVRSARRDDRRAQCVKPCRALVGPRTTPRKRGGVLR